MILIGREHNLKRVKRKNHRSPGSIFGQAVLQKKTLSKCREFFVYKWISFLRIIFPNP